MAPLRNYYFQPIPTREIWVIGIALLIWVLFQGYSKMWPESSIGIGMHTRFVPYLLLVILGITSSLIVNFIVKKWNNIHNKSDRISDEKY